MQDRATTVGFTDFAGAFAPTTVRLRNFARAGSLKGGGVGACCRRGGCAVEAIMPGARPATGESLEDVPARRDRREHDQASL